MSRVARSEVIDRAWRAIGAGVEALSAADGGPLSRTVKLILLPLVVRPTANRDLAGAVLDQDAAARLHRVIIDAAATLRACAGWWVVLGAAAGARRAEGIEISRDALYPRAWELAVTVGPVPADATGAVADVLDDLVEEHQDRGRKELDALLADAAEVAELERLVQAGADAAHTAAARAFTGSAAAGEPGRIDTADRVGLPACRRFLDAFAPEGTDAEVRRAATAAWEDMRTDTLGTETGLALNDNRWPAPEPGQAKRLGLTVHERPPRPAVRPTQTASAPWDRSIAERVRSLLRHSRNRQALLPVSDLARAEARRATAPWQLADEDSRLVMTAGTTLAADIDDGETRAHGILRSMRRRESWLAWASRQPDAVVVELAYVPRLWVRVHGAEAHGTLSADAAEVQSLLVGVWRSVLLDERSRVRAALSKAQAGT